MHKVADAIAARCRFPSCILPMPPDGRLPPRSAPGRAAGHPLYHGADLYRGRLQEQFAIETLILRLTIGRRSIRSSSTNFVSAPSARRRGIIICRRSSLGGAGAEGVIFGCTEMACWCCRAQPAAGLDTAAIHAEDAVNLLCRTDASGVRICGDSAAGGQQRRRPAPSAGGGEADQADGKRHLDAEAAHHHAAIGIVRAVNGFTTEIRRRRTMAQIEAALWVSTTIRRLT